MERCKSGSATGVHPGHWSGFAGQNGPGGLTPLFVSSLEPEIFTMEKIKQIIFVTLLTIIALNLPCMTRVAHSDQFIGPGGTTSDSGHSPSDSTGITTRDNVI